jgi:outer membrane protein assembly factor BamA
MFVTVEYGPHAHKMFLFPNDWVGLWGLQLRAGQIFNIEAGKKALRNVNGLALFSNIEVNPRPDEDTDGGIVVEVKLKELEQKTAEVSTEWSIVPGSSGRPSLVIFLSSFNPS